MEKVLADFSHDSLKPLTYTRSVSDVEAGGSTIFEHVENELEYDDFSVLVPEYLEDVTRKNSELYGLERSVNDLPDDDYLLYNPSVIPDSETVEEIEELEKGESLLHDEQFVAGITDQELEYGDLKEATESFTARELDSDPLVLEYPWDLFQNNGELIEKSFPGAEIKGEIADEAVVKGENLYLEEGAEIDPNAVIDASEGPVYIDENSRVWPNSRIEGPAYIGSDTKVGAGQAAVIHENSHIGDNARAGGEIEESIIHSFTNKYHAGFLGHAVVGSWTNIGADTTNSDLKNTYSNITVNHPVEGEINAGKKVGPTIGDHTKTDIGTKIYTGKQIGPVAKLADTVMDDVPPFTFINPGEKMDYRVDKANEHVEQMMKRREEHLPEGYIKAQKQLLDNLDDIT